VKRDVGGHEMGRVTARRRAGDPAQIATTDVARFGALRREAHHSRLERQTRFPQVAAEFRRGLQQVAHGPVDLLEDRLRTEGDAPRPLAVLDLNDPHRRQRLQRFADCGTAYAETSHKIPLGRQESAGLDFTLLDQLEQPVEDLVGEFPAGIFSDI
jgi:hypothetical protein